MERISFIDLGSNSVRFVITEVSDAGSYRLIYQEKESIRLSENMWEENRLTTEAMSRAIRSLKAFSHMAQTMACTRSFAVATAAVRLASNGDEFLKLVKEETGFDLECIAGEEEARLGFLGVINTIDLRDFVIFDLGCASTEITLVRDREIKKAVSLPIGALTLIGTYQAGADLTTEEYSNMVKAIQNILRDNKWLMNANLPLIGIGGTARNVAKMDQRRLNYPVTKLHNYILDKENFGTIVGLVKNKPLAQRKKIPGLSTDRADIIVAGLTIIQELMNYIGAEQLYVGGCGLREGLFYDYYGKEYLGGQAIIEDILMYSAKNILLGMDEGELIHAKFVAKLSSELFDKLEPLHHGSQRMKKLLTVAALLHDIGKRINYYSHARHGAYMLVNSNLYGISHIEQALCALMVMNSHGLTPKEYKNFIYGRLLNEELMAIGQHMSLVLALAEAFDESHEQFVTALHADIDEKIVTVVAKIKDDCDVSVTNAAVMKLEKSFKKEFNKQLKIIWI